MVPRLHVPFENKLKDVCLLSAVGGNVLIKLLDSDATAEEACETSSLDEINSVYRKQKTVGR